MRSADADAIRAALACGRPGCECARPGGNTHCPAHNDERPSLAVAERDGKLLVRCFAGCEQQAVLAALRERGLWPARPTPAAAPPSASWRIHSPDSRLVAVHERFDGPAGKRFAWRRPDGRAGLGGLSPRALLYGAERLAALADGATVLVCEGEKSADAARALGAEAVATVCGAACVPADAVLAPLARLDPVLWPDADLPGERHMQRLAARLAALGGRPRWLTWPAAPPGGDAADFLASGGTAKALQALIAAAVPWAPAHEPEPEPATPPARAVLRCLADVQPEPIQWLWPGYIPLGKLAVLDGDPGLGKSLLTLDLAARVSAGRAMPDGARGDLDGPRPVLLLSAEDDAADTIRPRLEAAGADPWRVYVLDAVRRDDESDASPTLLDVDALEAAITQTGAALVVIDPLMAYMPALANSWRDQDVRRVLAPLAALAARTSAAVVVVRHLNKSTSAPALYRGGGSIGIIAAARSALVVARDPDDAAGQRRVLAVSKCNLAALAPSMAYAINAPGGVPRLAWLGASPHGAAALLAATGAGEAEPARLDEACSFLREVLAEGPVDAREVLRQARDAGIAEITLRRAKERLGVRAVKRGGHFGGVEQRWLWTLAEDDHVAEDDHHIPRSSSAEAHGQATALKMIITEDDHLQSATRGAAVQEELGQAEAQKMIIPPRGAEDDHLSAAALAGAGGGADAGNNDDEEECEV